MDAGMASQGQGREPERRGDLNGAKNNFIKEFSRLIGEGQPWLSSIQALQKTEKNSELKGALSELADAVEGGTSISEAMKKREDIWDPITIYTATSGELGGVMDLVLQRLVERNQLLAATANQSPSFHLPADARKICVNLGHLVNCGVPILIAFRLAKEGVSDPYCQALDMIHDSIREGDSMLAGIERAKAEDLFGPVFMEAVRNGEETGELDIMLLDLAKRT